MMDTAVLSEVTAKGSGGELSYGEGVSRYIKCGHELSKSNVTKLCYVLNAMQRYKPENRQDTRHDTSQASTKNYQLSLWIPKVTLGIQAIWSPKSSVRMLHAVIHHLNIVSAHVSSLAMPSRSPTHPTGSYTNAA